MVSFTHITRAAARLALAVLTSTVIWGCAPSERGTVGAPTEGASSAPTGRAALESGTNPDGAGKPASGPGDAR
jgi:hypothetical protein